MGGIWQQGADHLRGDVDRHAGAGRHPGLRRLLSARTRSSRRPGRRTTRSHYYAFWLGVLAAVLTAFYSWPADLADLPRRAARRHERPWQHVHESPPVMTDAADRAGASAPCFAGLARRWHGRRRRASSGPARSSTGPSTTTCSHEMHDVPFLVKLAPLIALALGHRPLLRHATSGGPALPARARRRGPARSTASCYNKWYFDELYDLLFVRARQALGYGLWRGGDVGDHRPLRPGRRRRARRWTSARRAVRLQTGYVYHYAFAMLIGVAALVSWYLYRDCSGERHERLAAALPGDLPAAGRRRRSSC